MFDLDFSFSPPSHNTLAMATAANGPWWPNPPWSTALLRGLLDNPIFRRDFINSFADHLNSTLRSASLIAVVDSLAPLYAPAVPAWQDRWDIAYNWAAGVQSLRDFTVERPSHLRQHIIQHFGLAGTTPVTVAVSDPAMGKVRLNRLLIDERLPGLPAPGQPYPWSGVYFQGVPITAEALPAPGCRFVAWQAEGAEPVLTVTPGAQPLTLTAIFAADAGAPVTVHHWHFNDLPSGTLTAIDADISLPGGATITYPGTGAGYLDRVDPGTTLGGLPEVPAGYALRARNPSDTRELVLTLPSTGYENLALSYAVTRTVNGAQEHAVYYRVAEAGAWTLVAGGVEVTEAFTLVAHDLSAFTDARDNPELAVKFVFGGANAGGSSGNQRFDNITLTGVPLAGANLPPQVAQPVGLQPLIEGAGSLAVDLAAVFHDPEGDPLAFAASSGDGDAAAVALSGSVLSVAPLLRGEAWITVTAADPYHDPVPHSFRVLIYPAAAALSAGGYAFTSWDPDLPERTYPPHMLFLQSDANDPGLTTPLLYPYFIPHDDYHADDQETIGFPYNNTGRTRINGLDQDGIAFVNTGRGRDLGAALLSLDTRGVGQATVAWLAGTLLPNSRVYAIRLQYRLGVDGDFNDLLIDGQPQEYLRSEQAGDVHTFAPVALPAELLAQPHLQLLWRYYHVSGTSGARAQLRLDDLVVAGAATGVETDPPPAATALLGNAPNPFNPSTVISFSVRAGETAALAVYNGRGQRVRTLGRFPAGHHRQTWDGTDDAGRRCVSGVYFYRLASPSGSWTGKMVMLK